MITVEMLRKAKELLARNRVAGPVQFYCSPEAFTDLTGLPAPLYDGAGPDETWLFWHTDQHTRLPGYW